MIEKIMIAIISGVFCSMATAIIAMIVAPKILKSLVLEEVAHHSAEFHKESVTDAIASHTKNCVANGTIVQIRDAVLWLVIRAGGEPEKLGLIKRDRL